MKIITNISYLRGMTIAVVLQIIIIHTAQAMPMFARKYQVSCATCHTSPPRLNETGFRFRAAGFCWPAEIGKNEEMPFKFTDYSSVRLQARYDGSRSEVGTAVTTSNRGRLQAIELYPMTGAWGKYYSTNFKVTYVPGDDAMIENAYVKFVKGNAKKSLSVRAGIFHLYDGIGAADAPATISRPLIQSAVSNFDQSTFFRTWGLDQLGVEAGYDYRRTSLRVSVLNGVSLHRRKGVLRAYGDQGGPLTRSAALPTTNKADVQLYLNQLLPKSRGSVAFHYYHGNIVLPAAAPLGSFENSFHRAAGYANYNVGKRLQLYSGFQYGRDRRVASAPFASRGLFVEAATPITALSALGVRYDWFDPAAGKSRNEVQGLTAYGNLWFKSQFRVVAEYQHRQTLRGTLANQQDNAFQMRIIFIK